MKERKIEDNSPNPTIKPSTPFQRTDPGPIQETSRYKDHKEVKRQDESRPSSKKQWYKWKKEDRHLAKLRKQQEKEIEMYDREEQRLKELELAAILYEKQRIKQALIEKGNYGQRNPGYINTYKKETKRERKRRKKYEKMREQLFIQNGHPYWSELEMSHVNPKLSKRHIQYEKRYRSGMSFSQKVRACFYKMCCQFYCWLTIVLIIVCGFINCFY